jgi:hypothetical protein
MRRREQRLGSLLLLLGWLAACGETRPAPALATSGNAGRFSVGEAGHGGGAIDAGGDAGAGGSGEADSPEVVIVDVPAAEPCTVSDAEPRVFMPPEPLQLVFDRAGAAGPRYFAFDSASLALITFGKAGADPSPISYITLAAVAAFGEDLVTLELGDGGELLARSYDGFLEPQDGELTLETDATFAHALGASPESLVALWGSGGELRGRAFTPDGSLDATFDFGPRSCTDHGCKPFALWTGERFVVLWSRNDDAARSVLSWAVVTREGTIEATRNVLRAEDPYSLVGAARLADGQLAILLTEGAPAVAPVLLVVDEFGVPNPVLQRLQGASEAWGIASSAAGLAVVARSNTAQAVFRGFNADREPLGTWVCIDDSGIDTAFEPRAALFSEASGYAAVVRQTDGSAAYLPGIE